ncbi:unnamed protein product, partial [Lymnaea stagnalis]
EHNRSIIHIDIDCFYAQVEMLHNPELCNKPLGIQQKNIIVTCNYVARQLGVNKCTYVTDALKLCPQLILVSGEDLTNYRQMSYQISEFIKKYSPHVERLGLDENFVDVSELVSWRLQDGNYKTEFLGHVYTSSEYEGNIFPKPTCNCGCELRLQIASQIAADIREALRKELGITSCAGIAHNKLLAKLVGAVHKPNQQTSLLPHMAVGLISSLLSVGKIPGIGLTTGNMLKQIGITTIKDLQSFDKQTLEREFGPVKADFLIKCSQGVDDSPVLKYGLPQTLSDEDSFKCCSEYKDAEERIKNLLISLLKRLIEDGRVPQTVRLTIRRVADGYKTWQSGGKYVYRKRESRQCPVPGLIFTGLHQTVETCATDMMCERLMPVLMTLFKKLVDPSKPFHLTLLSISFANLVKSNTGKGKISSLLKKHADSKRNKMAAESLKAVYCTKHDGDIVMFKPKNSQNENTSSIMHYFKQTSVSHQGSATLPEETSPVNNPSSQTVKKHKSSDAPLPRETVHDQQVAQNNVEVTTISDFIPEKSCTPIPRLGEPSTVPLFSQACSDSMSDSVTDIKMNTKKSAKNSHMRKIYGNAKHGQNLEMAETVNKTVCQNEESDSLQRLLPEGIDAKTVSELPYALQKEILAQYGILAEGDDCRRRYTLMSKTITTRSHSTAAVQHSTAAVQFSPMAPAIKRLRPQKRAEEERGSDEGSSLKVRKLSSTEGADSLPVTGETQEPTSPVSTHAKDAGCEESSSTIKQSKVNEDPTVHSVSSCTKNKMKYSNDNSAREAIKSVLPLGTVTFENKHLQPGSGQSPISSGHSTTGGGPSPNVSCQSPSKSDQSTKHSGPFPNGSGQSHKRKGQSTKGSGQSPKSKGSGQSPKSKGSGQSPKVLFPNSNFQSTNGFPKMSESHLMLLSQKKSSNAVASPSTTMSTIVSNEIDPTVFSELPKNIQSEILA